jgi:hypothetical protein
VPTKSARLLALSLILAVSTVALTVWAVGAYRYAGQVRGWPTALGTVIAEPSHKAAIRFPDSTGAQHLMPLQPGDTDDLPVGSVIRISYHLSGGRVRSEFRVQPGAKASALTVLALLAALGVGVTWWRAAQERAALAAAAH